jgi:hypothetical protein
LADKVGVENMPALRDRPELDEHLDFEWRAFRDLRNDRIAGLSLGSIWWTSIDAYARRHRIDDPDAFERFALLMQAMDDAYRAHMAELSKTRA